VYMKIVFLIAAAAVLALFLITRNRFKEYIEPLDKSRYPLKGLMPMGFYIIKLTGYKFNTGYDRKLLSMIAEIYGPIYSQFYLQVHMANKITFLLAGLVFVSAVGAAAGPDAGFVIFAAAVLAGIAYLPDRELGERVRKRRLMIQLDFPDFLNKLILLINAGMTIQRAWEKIVADNKRSRPLYDELQQVLSEIRSGIPINQAYEDFSKRCRTPEITKFISVIIQNLKKGSSEVVSILRVQANECWELRKNAAKKQGEEASAKMMLPLMIMLLAILIIVAVPAILAMQGVV